jgi:thioredoxin reductase (NADPH)
MAEYAGEYDVVVVGGGLAGLTAGLYAARYGRSTLVFEATAPGGHLVNVETIEAYPGFPEGVSGFELGPTVQEQAADAGAAFELAEARAIEPLDGPGGDPGGAARGGWVVATDGGRYRARAVIVASGTRARPLGVPGEERLYGKGVSHCASCDGPLFRGGTVGVVAGDAWALQEALTLARYAGEVLVFHAGDAPPGQEIHRRRVAEAANVRLRPHATVEEVLGDGAVAGVRVRAGADGPSEQIELAALFVYAGLAPNTAPLGDLVALDAEGHVRTDISMRAARPGLFAVGGVRADFSGLAAAAAGDGATAAAAAHRSLESGAWPDG